MFAVPLWTVAGVGLCFTAMLAHAWHDDASSTWLQVVVALAFFAMVAVFGTACRVGAITILRASAAGGATSP